MSIDPGELVRWFQSQPPETDVELNVLSARFAIGPERLRDQLRRLVEQGLLVQSDPVPGLADTNPTYRVSASVSASSID